MQDEQVERFLQSGNERAVLLTLRAHRITALLALGLFAAWLFLAFVLDDSSMKGAAFGAFAVALLASLALKFTARELDRRAMARDLALLEDKPK